MPAGVQYELFLDGAASPYGTVTMTGQNYFRPSAPLAPGGPPPGTTHSITVRACRTSDPTCCASAAPVSVSLVEECTTPIPASPSNIIFSEYIVAGGTSELGEAIEITNLSHCPVALNGNHFEYCNSSCSSGSYRWMDFGPSEIVPPRGVYVAIRDRVGASCSYPFLGADDPGLFGLRVSTLAMMGPSLSSGWFLNSVGMMRIASGAWTGAPFAGSEIDYIASYLSSAGACNSIGYNAVNACGDVTAAGNPTTLLNPNQLGRLWRPCDAVVGAVPACF
jgi:hypothetical protein